MEWLTNSLCIKDCFIALKQENPNRFILEFSAKGLEKDDVQLWSGFGYKDRDNRYSLGLRGGNNQDIYLCKYQSGANNKMLALESIDFDLKPNEWYHLKVVFWEGNIRVYLNDETQARIVAFDDNYLTKGSSVLGGGWLKTEYKELKIVELSDEKIDHYAQDSIKYSLRLSSEEKEKKRKNQREKYKAQKIEEINSTRTEVFLNGDWLFLPAYEVKEDDEPYAEKTDDSKWHIMNVPGFWNPVRNWLHLQDSHLPHSGSGISDNYREKEQARCNAFTFDYQKTQSAWYRHAVELAVDVKSKKWVLHFDAVSKIADVYVNGQLAGRHIGMFGDFEYDISRYLHRGKNIIAVKVVVRKDEKAADADEKVTQAVSVDITNEMLNSLPYGMFRGDEGGIWQGVKLIASQALHINDVYANTRMNGAKLELEIKNDNPTAEKIEAKFKIFDLQTGELFYTLSKTEEKIINPGQTIIFNYETAELSPKLWSPEKPNLYKLATYIYRQDELIDEVETTIGFRTVGKTGNQFSLNGNPYWLRGANHPPCGIAPNDPSLANTFFKLMHDGNEMITRSHGCPFTEAWMNAADKQGVGVSYEGSWPWLMISNIPSEELLQIWKEEMLALVKKYRNHPSLFIWTINNEMYFTMFYHNDPPELRLKKWKIISELIREIRKLSPNTLVSADSGYGRIKADYDKNLKPHDIDDGDIDDRHVYFNWYNRDFFQVYNGEWAKRIYWSPGANPDRIFFSQETSTGYTNNDNGHYNRKYLFNNYVPQAWLGDWAYEEKNPKHTLQRHAFMTKELYEAIRRTSPETAGVLLFANLCWFKNVYDENRIKPYPVYDAVKKAASPVLISAELFGRNFYVGTSIKPRICIVNNNTEGEDIPLSTIEWKVVHNNQVLSSGVQQTAIVKHYDRQWQECEINLPENIPNPRSSCKLVIELKSGDKLISENDYDILLTTKDWAKGNSKFTDKKIAVFDLSGKTFNVLDSLNVRYQKMEDLTEVRIIEADLLIVANLDIENEIPYNWEDVRRVCNNGTNVLLIHPGKHLKWIYYNEVESIYERKGRVVNMHIPEHGTFNDIEPMELAWWHQEENELPRACRRSYRLKDTKNMKSLCTYIRPHTGLGKDRQSYLYEMSGIPLLEIKEGKGRMIASEMETNLGYKDPIAARLLVNLLQELLK